MTALAVCGALAGAGAVRAQSIEPRSYSNAPVGVNFLIGGYAYTRGGLAFESLPITDPKLATSSAVVGYARILDLAGKSAKFDVIVPYTWLSGTANYLGDSLERKVDGFGDPAFRLSVNFYGAPALTLRDYPAYKQDLVIGASVQVTPPWGQYDPSRVVNLGTNRWSIKPDVGFSKSFAPFTIDLTAGVTLFSRNDDYFGGQALDQAPLGTGQPQLRLRPRHLGGARRHLLSGRPHDGQ